MNNIQYLNLTRNTNCHGHLDTKLVVIVTNNETACIQFTILIEKIHENLTNYLSVQISGGVFSSKILDTNMVCIT